MNDLAKKLAEQKQHASTEKAKELPKETAKENRVEPPVEIENPPTEPHFRVFNFSYQFKVSGGRVLKASVEGIYTPENQQDVDFLTLQVSRGLIHFY